MIRTSAAIFAIFFHSALSFAETDHTNAMWIGLFQRAELDENLGLHQEFQIRNNTETGITGQSLFRAGPLWTLNDSQEVGLLYAFVRTGAQTEHRLTQQFIQRFDNGLSFRFRFEQRTLEKTDGVSLRARLNARYQKPLNDALSFVLWDEFFYQPVRPSWIYGEGFDRNRAFAGFRYRWSKMNAEIGYMNQYTNRAGGDLSEHTFLLYLIF